MKTLFIGGSSEIALDVASKLKNVDCISKKKCKGYIKNFKIKDYKINNIKKIFKSKKKKYDNILIFNGSYENSILSNFSSTEFEKSFYINFKLPLLLFNEAINNKILNYNGAVYFISSIAAESTQSGNAYYTLSKNTLNLAAKILANEQKKRGVRVNVISLGVVNNKMGKSTLANVSKSKLKFIKKKIYVEKIIKILKNKKINEKKIFIK